MSTANDGDPTTTSRRFAWRPILFTLLFGLLSGAALSAVAYYRIATGDVVAVELFAGIALFCWLFVGFLTAQRTASVLTGALTGFCFGLLGAILGLVTYQLILPTYADAWYARASQFCAQAIPQASCKDQPTFLANEMTLTIISLIAWPVAALILGFIGGYVGSTSAARHAIGDEYEGGTVTIHPPLVPGHRTTRSQGIDFPQGDRPSI